MSGIKIIIPCKKTKTQVKNKTNIVNLDDQIEVKKEYLKLFYSCWIKCINIHTDQYNSGGFLTNIENGIIYLRSIHNPELLSFEIDMYIFYVKKNTEQYYAMQEIVLFNDKLNTKDKSIKDRENVIEKKERILENNYRRLEKDKLQYEQIKYKFYKLFQDNKITIK